MDQNKTLLDQLRYKWTKIIKKSTQIFSAATQNFAKVRQKYTVVSKAQCISKALQNRPTENFYVPFHFRFDIGHNLFI